MASTPWDEAWFEHLLPDLAMLAWRGVEAQHVVSTMRLVDTLAEQAVLEALLERSKPALPPAAVPPHYLLATPFRYRPLHPSRLRRGGSAGLWYGAASLRTACAEVAYWRWRFLMDSAGLQTQVLLTEHSFFQAGVQGRALDLTSPPWTWAREAWTHPDDYRAPQALAEAARGRAVQWIRYESVRDPGGICAAVLDVAALQMAGSAAPQTWHCKTTRSAVLMVRDSERHEWASWPGMLTSDRLEAHPKGFGE
jgi:hypothetical protein